MSEQLCRSFERQIELIFVRQPAFDHIGAGERDVIALVPVADLDSIPAKTCVESVEAFRRIEEVASVRRFPGLHTSSDKEMIVKGLKLRTKGGLKALGRNGKRDLILGVDKISVVGESAKAQKIREYQPVHRSFLSGRSISYRHLVEAT